MPRDPFARFESSGGGWLAPTLVFVIGAVLTVAAIEGLHAVASAPDDAAPAPNLPVNLPPEPAGP